MFRDENEKHKLNFSRSREKNLSQFSRDLARTRILADLWISSLFSGSKDWVFWYYKLLGQNNAIYILRNKNLSYWQSFSGENKLCFHFSFRWGWLNLSLCLTSLISSANLAGLARLERIWLKLYRDNSFNYVRLNKCQKLIWQSETPKEITYLPVLSNLS